MERRRFVPSAEGLEGRQMLSTTAAAVPTATATPPAQVQATLINNTNISPLRSIRIDRLHAFFYRIDPNRVVPPTLITELQNDLRAIEGQLHRASPVVLNTFNQSLRGVQSHRSLHEADAIGLNFLFGKVLETAGANPAIKAKFQADMNELAKIDSTARNPAVTAANDYAFMTQLVVGIGIPVPVAGTLARTATK